MRRKLFLKIVKGINTYEADPLPDHFNFFRVRPDATGRMSLSVIMKCTTAIRQLAYGTTPDAFDEYLQMSERTARDSLTNFNKCIISLYMAEYLRNPTLEDVENFHDRDNTVAGANNDINVLDNSLLFDDLLNDTAPVLPYVVNGVGYEKGYYLADGARKDVERAFGVLQGRWGIIQQPTRPYHLAVFDWNEVYADPARNMLRTWIERCETQRQKNKEMRDRDTHNEESVKDMKSKFDKSVKFEGQNFRRCPVWSKNETLKTTRKRMKWENDYYICRGHILNGMSDSLFDIYQNAESAKALWESLESKYMVADAFTTKFLPSSSKIAEDEVEGTDDIHGPSVLRKSTKTRKAKSFGFDFQLYLVEGTRDKTLFQCEYCFIIEEDPRTLSEAMASRDVAFWKEAVQSAIDSIMHNDTWELTDLPPRCKALGCFRQKEGIDFFDTYAPVARIFTIRLLLALAAIHDLVIHQMDLKTAFLNGDLDEEIYMKQPEGFMMPGQKSKTKKLLSSKFDMKDLGEAEVILCINIKRDPTVKFRRNKGTLVSQLEYSRAIGCIMYAMISTRTYIAFAVGKLSSLTYNGYPSVIEGYFDASWINNMEDHSSTSGWIFLLGGGVITWASIKQTCIISSTMESEFVALAAAVKMKRLIQFQLLFIAIGMFLATSNAVPPKQVCAPTVVRVSCINDHVNKINIVTCCIKAIIAQEVSQLPLLLKL
nr:zinc finger, CCHC-type [Tanacetum cinerariifolium]